MHAEPKYLVQRYRLKLRLGQGAYAQVYEAWDEELNRPVAIKIFNRQRVASLADPQAREFRRELEVATNLAHPTIARVYAAGNDPQTSDYFMIMEYVPGKDLATVLRSEGALPFKQSFELMAEICSAVSYLHSKGIIHRDIKPANIIVSNAGNRTPKLVDLGLAKIMDSTKWTKTATGLMVGTPSYMSPEQCVGQPVDARSDVFALGAVLYECLTAKRAFDAETPIEAAYRCIHESPESLAESSNVVPPCVEAIVLTALAKDPKCRYQTVEEMQRDINAVLAALQNDAALPMLPMPSASEFPSSPFHRPSSGAGPKQVPKRTIAFGWASLLAILSLVWFFGLGSGPQSDRLTSRRPDGLRVAETDPSVTANVRANALLARLDALRQSGREYSDDYVETAVALAQKMRWDKQQDRALQVLADCRPSSTRRGRNLEHLLHATRGQILADQRHYETALPELLGASGYMETFNELHKQPYHLSLADCYAHLNQKEKAAVLYQKALAEFPSGTLEQKLAILMSSARNETGQLEGTSAKLFASYNELVNAEFTRLVRLDRGKARELLLGYRDQQLPGVTVENARRREAIVNNGITLLKQ